MSGHREGHGGDTEIPDEEEDAQKTGSSGDPRLGQRNPRAIAGDEVGVDADADGAALAIL